MWPGFDGSLYTREQFAAHVADLTIGRYAKFIVMHATGSPTLAQWMAYPEAQRVAILHRYCEQSLGWSRGPHRSLRRRGFRNLQARQDRPRTRLRARNAIVRQAHRRRTMKGWRTLIFGALMVVGPPLLTYVAGVDWKALGVSPAVSAAIGAVVIALRAMTDTPIGSRS